jgi:quinolinate synthase
MNYSVNKKDLKDFGYLKAEVPEDIDLKAEIDRLRKEKNAVILAHYYQDDKIQDIADFVGDSLDLSRKAANTGADIIVFAGVHFMAETAKILSPHKKVIVPDLNAGCSLADSCPTEEFQKFIKKYPGYVVISYINTTAEIKALSDIICTSTNALHIINYLPRDTKIIFAPDKNLGNYIKSLSGRDMVVWNGACHVHEEFSVERIAALRKQYQDAKIIAHPECEKPVLLMANHIGSTSSLLKYTISDSADKYIVATEPGIIHQMKKRSPHKTFIPAPPKDSTCGCSECNFMKLNTLKKIYVCMKYELPEITLDEKLRAKAEKPILKMLEISEKIGI